MADSKKYDGSQWEHSLRKLATATEAVENPLYSDGTAITTYNIKGNTVQDGTPTPSNPVSVNGVGERTANLFDKDRTAGIIPNAYINQSGQQTSSQNYYLSYPLSVESNAVYTWNFNSEAGASHTAPTVAFYDSSDNMLGVAAHDSAIYHFTFTTPVNCTYIRASVYVGLSMDTGMLLQGSVSVDDNRVIPFIPYGYKIPILTAQGTSNIYLSEPLYKIGDTADTINLDGTVTRRIGKIDLGSLSWRIGSSGNITTTENVPNLHIVSNVEKDNAFCTILSETYPSYVASTNYSFSSCLNLQPQPFINKTGFEGLTADQFKEAVKGEYMYYILATPTTETVTAPSIPTTDGANSITVDTTVQPSEFTATWTGWHDSSVKEWDGSQWQ